MSAHTLILILAFGSCLLTARGLSEVCSTERPDLSLPAIVHLEAIGFAPMETADECCFVNFMPVGTWRHVLGRNGGKKIVQRQRTEGNGRECESLWHDSLQLPAFRNPSTWIGMGSSPKALRIRLGCYWQGNGSEATCPSRALPPGSDVDINLSSVVLFSAADIQVFIDSFIVQGDCLNEFNRSSHTRSGGN
jgi:hypothetical protein